MPRYIPRRYQAETAIACWRDIESRHDGGAILVLPTGCGKTFVAAMVMDAHLEHPDSIVLFATPTVELARQQLSALKNLLPHRTLTSSHVSPPVDLSLSLSPSLSVPSILNKIFNSIRRIYSFLF